MAQYYGNTTPPMDVKYAVYEMENVSANAKREEDRANNVWVTDEEAEAAYQKSLKKEKIKKVFIIAAICVGVILFALSYIV